LALGIPAAAQQPKKVFRIGYLSTLSLASDQRAEPFRVALRERGYIEGQNITLEYRYAAGKWDQLPELAVDLVRLKVDIIVVSGGNPAIRAAINATKSIPIVMMGQGFDPVRSGFIDSLAHPGGNLTGYTNFSRELGGKRLELLKEAVPKLARVAILYDPASGGAAREVKEDLAAAARALKLIVQPREVSDVRGLEKEFAALPKERPDGLYMIITGDWMNANLKRIADLALKSRLPSVGNTPWVYAGGLMSYAAVAADGHRRVAYFVDRILKGTKPGDLPVAQPMKFEFVINLKTAKQIGVTIQPEVLARATRLIK
jgi:putative ABC transport system substrate-binding protein